MTAPGAQRPATASTRTIVVKQFQFSGNTLYSTAQLEAIVAPYTGREITLTELYEAADKVADYYHVNGYSLAFVVPPAQKLTEGTVKLEVVEGRVGAVAVEGNDSYETARIERYLGATDKGRVYRLEDLDTGLRRLNMLPGMSARATLRPGQDYGTSDLLINADEHRWAASLSADNYGRENIGETRATLSGSFNNPLRYGDQLQLLYMSSEQGLLQYGYLGYNAPIGYSGLRGNVSLGQATFTAETGTPDVTVDGENTTLRAGVEWPFRVTRDGGTSFSAAVTKQESNADLAGVTITNPIDITLLELGATNSHVFANQAAYQLAVTAAGNFKSTTRDQCDGDDSNGEDCNRQALRLETDLQFVQPLIGRLDVFVRGNAVYSPDPLPPVSPFALGGPNSVRGYATSEVRGDRGAFGTLALRYGLALGPVQTQLRVFGDSGYAETLEAAPGASDHDSLGSYGVGADIFYKRDRFRLSGKVDFSRASDNHVSSDGEDGDRVYAQVSAGF